MTTANSGSADRAAPADDDGNITVTTEQVAAVVAGIPQIGAACDALRSAGRRATIAGNRISVDDRVYAQFVCANVGMYGRTNATWLIYHAAGTPPVWIVGAEPLVSLAR
ncbi:hypothetical protein [Mycobacterium sp. C31M]